MGGGGGDVSEFRVVRCEKSCVGLSSWLEEEWGCDLGDGGCCHRRVDCLVEQVTQPKGE